MGVWIMFSLKDGALLFDCDGTITDEAFLPAIVGKTIRQIVEAEGLTYNSSLFDGVFEANKGGGFDKYYLGYLNGIQSQHILNKVGLQNFSERAIDNYLEATDAIAKGKDIGIKFDINPDAIAVIQWANQQNIPVAIVTNANERIARANLEAAGIGIAGETRGIANVALVVHRGYYGENAINRKPSAFPYEEACRLLNVSPANCIGFEDSLNGHLSLTRAGVSLRFHVSERNPEAISFVKDGEECRPSTLAPYGKLSSSLILEAIEQHNNTGKVVNLPDFAVAAYAAQKVEVAPEKVSLTAQPR